LKSLIDPNGGTDFDPPLTEAKRLIDKHHNKFEKFVLVMMSDGESEFPTTGIENIKKSPAMKKL
jgi:uncharacterized protein with von Willebrand factor type A (vWA) domain